MRSYGFWSLSFVCAMFCSSLALGAEVKKLDPVTIKGEQIGKVEKFQGVARILSGDKITEITAVGQAVLSGDKIKTEQGEVEIKFNDGAELKVTPFSLISASEKKETKGVFFKSTEDARRLTAFVGKASFKSAGDQGTKKNYLQTPTAVCALRGTEVDWGVAGVSSYLKILSGSIAKTVGKIEKVDVVPNSNANNANGNKVFAALAAAAKTVQSETKEQQEAFAVQQLAAQSMLNNPDAEVKAIVKMEVAVIALSQQILAVNQKLETALATAAAATTPEAKQAAQTAIDTIATTLTTIQTQVETIATALSDTSRTAEQQLSTAVDSVQLITQTIVSSAVISEQELGQMASATVSVSANFVNEAVTTGDLTAEKKMDAVEALVEAVVVEVVPQAFEYVSQ